MLVCSLFVAASGGSSSDCDRNTRIGGHSGDGDRTAVASCGSDRESSTGIGAAVWMSMHRTSSDCGKRGGYVKVWLVSRDVDTRTALTASTTMSSCVAAVAKSRAAGSCSRVSAEGVVVLDTAMAVGGVDDLMSGSGRSNHSIITLTLGGA